jgi:hypothetical protein
LATIAQSFLAVVFLAAALAKTLDSAEFRRSLARIPWLPSFAAQMTVRGLPLLEFGLAAAFCFVPRLAALGAVIVLTSFTAVVAFERASGRYLDCGCFGSTRRREADWSFLVRNGLLLVASILALVGSSANDPGAALVGIGLGCAFLLVQFGSETVSAARS